MHTDLVLLRDLSHRRTEVEAALGTLDETVAGSLTGAGLVAANIARSPLTSWLVQRSGSVAGVFALAPTPRAGFDLQMSIYLVDGFRGQGLVEDLYLAAGSAAAAESLAVCSIVAETNLRSLAAHRKVFGVYRPFSGRGVRFPDLRFAIHDLRMLPADRQAAADPDLVRTIRAGLRSAGAS